MALGPALPTLLKLTGLDRVLSIRPDIAATARRPPARDAPEHQKDPASTDRDTIVVLADSAAPLGTSERLRALVESHEAGKRARRQALEEARSRLDPCS